MKILSKIIAINVLFLVFFNAQAATLTLDTYIGRANIGSSGVDDEKEVLAAAVEQWENTATLYDNTSGSWTNTGASTGEFTKVDSGVNQLDSTTGFNYLTVSAKPSYFVLKFGGGNGSKNDYDLFFFKNEVSYNKLVWDNDFLDDVLCAENSTSKCAVQGKVLGLSHYLYSGDVSEVPLPAAVWLFGSAFAGLMGVARKRTKVA